MQLIYQYWLLPLHYKCPLCGGRCLLANLGGDRLVLDCAGWLTDRNCQGALLSIRADSDRGNIPLEAEVIKAIYRPLTIDQAKEIVDYGKVISGTIEEIT